MACREYTPAATVGKRVLGEDSAAREIGSFGIIAAAEVG
jgi:hypothetical protein